MAVSATARHWVTGLVVAMVLGLCSTAWAAGPCKLTKTKAAKDAKLKVYFTKFLKEDTTKGKYKKCRIVAKGGTPFFVTPFRQDANVVVHASNWAVR